MGSNNKGELPITGGNGNGNSNGDNGSGGGNESNGNAAQRALQIQTLANKALTAAEITDRNSVLKSELAAIQRQSSAVGHTMQPENLVTYAQGKDGKFSYLEVQRLQHIFEGHNGVRENRIHTVTGLTGVAMAKEIVRVATKVPKDGSPEIVESYPGGLLRVAVATKRNGWVVTAIPENYN